MLKLFRLVICLIGAVAALQSCSLKKNTAATRRYQAFITRYNIYYNGDEHFRETLQEMEKDYNDDYTTILYPHPAEAKGQPKTPQPKGDFTRSIEKAQKAIQLRSIKKRPAKKSGNSSPEYKAWLKREEYNPFLHNAWLMMGRSQYFNGDFAGAAATFYYIQRHFKWLPETVTEAQLWQARSYVAFDWTNEAETILKRIKPEELTSKKLKELYAFVEADIAVRRKDYAQAIEPIKQAIKYADGTQKARLQFLLGQCLRREGRNAEAYAIFKKAAASSSATYRAKLNARIAQSEVFAGKQIDSEVKSLLRMTRYDRNKKYLDQIYYAAGNLYLSVGDTAKAIENYVLANEKSERNGIEKAINNVTLGQLYFDRGRYDLAQPCMAEAIPQLPETYPNFSTLKLRSDLLDELAVYAGNVALQDSLLTLSQKPEAEQLKIINKIIDNLKKKEAAEAEEQALADFEAKRDDSEATNTGGNANAPQQFQMSNKDDSWYFYNTSVVAQGRTQFQRRWGSRKLEDDWRRKNKASFSFNEFESTGNDTAASTEGNAPGAEAPTPEGNAEKDKAAAERASDPHYPEYYLSQIPKTEEQKATAHDVIQEGLYSMGLILKDKLEDFPAARRQWSRLLKDYPDNAYRLDVYYNLFIVYERLEQKAEANIWRQRLIEEFPESKYGIALQNPDYIQNLRDMPAAQQELYDKSYTAYLANDNATVHEAYAEMMRRYPVSETMPKFMFLHALAYVTERKPEEFNATLKEMLERYPDTDLSPITSAWLKGMARGRKLQEGDGNSRSMFWDTRLSTDSIEGDAAAQDAEFIFDPKAEHYLALVYPTDHINANELLYGIARHNFNTFVVKDFDLEQMTFGPLGMLIVKGFANKADTERYRTILGQSQLFVLPADVTPIIIAKRNFDQLISKGHSFEEYFNAEAEANATAVEEQVITPTNQATNNDSEE